MITDVNELNKLLEFTKRAKESGATAEQVDEFLRSKGSSLEDVASVNMYGAENVSKARLATQGYKRDTMPSLEQTGDILNAGIGGVGLGAERVASGVTMGGYDWATKKLADATGVEDLDSRKRWENKKEEIESDGGKSLRNIASVGGGLAEFGGAMVSPLNKVVSGVTSPIASKVGGVIGKGLGGAVGGGVYGGLSSAFENDFDVDKTLSGAKSGAIIGGAIPVATDLSGKALKSLLGYSTGAGEKSIEQAYSAGKRGSKDFTNNMRGKIEETDVVNDLNKELEIIHDKAQKEYSKQMSKINDVSVDLGGVKQKLDKIGSDAMVGKVNTMSESRKKVYDQTKKLLSNYLKEPKAQNVRGADALKKQINDIKIDVNDRAGQNMKTKLYNLVKDEIVNKNKDYAKIMKNYGDPAEYLEKARKELSAGDKNIYKTLGKLQSMTRDTVSNRYGARRELVDKLPNKNVIYDKLAGMTLNKVTPRGVNGTILGTSAITGSIANPTVAIPALSGLLMTSPRLVGELSYGVGKLSNYVPELNKVLSGIESIKRGE